MKRVFLLIKENNQSSPCYGTFVKTFNDEGLTTTEDVTESNTYSHIGDAMKDSINIYNKLGVRYKLESFYITI